MFYAALALNVHEKGMRVATHIEKKGIWFVKSTRDPSFTRGARAYTTGL